MECRIGSCCDCCAILLKLVWDSDIMLGVVAIVAGSFSGRSAEGSDIFLLWKLCAWSEVVWCLESSRTDPARVVFWVGICRVLKGALAVATVG